MQTKKTKLIYWIATTLMIVCTGVFSIPDLIKLPAVKEAVAHLGFPDYLLPFFGTMKILGTLCAVIPALKRFREAAYAGIVFFFVGAIYCHAALGDPFANMAAPLLVLAITLTSYIYAKKLSVAEY